ncbi:MAG TPA: hypothetical protein VFS60_17120 [Thermoanaerobaculia bacterium]|nr:hypothetical protein [Thermoanaerobaculia bacterium]
MSDRLRSSVPTLLALALLAALAVGCRRKEAAEPAAGTSGQPNIVAVKVVPARVVDVALTGTSFQVVGSMAPGPARFRVRNVSSGRHSFAIDGSGQTFKLEDPLDPGESGTLDVELASGSFRIRCPLSGHTEPPRQLIVTQRAARP